jgi:hypothetical protein
MSNAKNNDIKKQMCGLAIEKKPFRILVWKENVVFKTDYNTNVFFQAQAGDFLLLTENFVSSYVGKIVGVMNAKDDSARRLYIRPISARGQAASKRLISMDPNENGYILCGLKQWAPT